MSLSLSLMWAGSQSLKHVDLSTNDLPSLIMHLLCFGGCKSHACDVCKMADEWLEYFKSSIFSSNGKRTIMFMSVFEERPLQMTGHHKPVNFFSLTFTGIFYCLSDSLIRQKQRNRLLHTHTSSNVLRRSQPSMRIKKWGMWSSIS